MRRFAIFDVLARAVDDGLQIASKAMSENLHIARHWRFPSMYWLPSGFPAFSDLNWSDKAPLDVGSIFWKTSRRGEAGCDPMTIPSWREFWDIAWSDARLKTYFSLGDTSRDQGTVVSQVD